MYSGRFERVAQSGHSTELCHYLRNLSLRIRKIHLCHLHLDTATLRRCFLAKVKETTRLFEG